MLTPLTGRYRQAQGTQFFLETGQQAGQGQEAGTKSGVPRADRVAGLVSPLAREWRSPPGHAQLAGPQAEEPAGPEVWQQLGPAFFIFVFLLILEQAWGASGPLAI